MDYLYLVDSSANDDQLFAPACVVCDIICNIICVICNRCDLCSHCPNVYLYR